MSNNELFDKMTQKFGVMKATEFAKMVSYMYKVLHENDIPGEFTENSYESNWWKEKYNELKLKEACISY